MSQFLVFDDVGEGVIDFESLKCLQSSFRGISLPDHRRPLDANLVQPMFAVSTNVADPAELFRRMPEGEDQKRYDSDAT